MGAMISPVPMGRAVDYGYNQFKLSNRAILNGDVAFFMAGQPVRGCADSRTVQESLRRRNVVRG